MTDAPDYAAIEAMAARTSMPWRAEIRNGGGATVYDGRHQMVATHLRAYTVDPELIVAAVNTLPALIARCRELEAKVAEAEELFKEQDRQHAWSHYGELSDVRCDCCGLRHAERQDYTCCGDHNHGHEWSDHEIVEALVCGDDCPPWSPFHERAKTFPFSDYDASPIPGDPTP